MRLGVIADDFTGASDIANTLAKGVNGRGVRTVQFIGVPHAPAAPDCQAGVISIKTRSIPVDAAVEQSIDALRWLQSQGCAQFIFKYCSTFDSTPKGNIGPVGEALARELGAHGVVVCPAFPTMKRTVYQGHLFVADRLLNESGLENHPLNPMTDPDIRRWLALQCTEPVGLVPYEVVAEGRIAIGAALEASAARGERLSIVDAIADRDLIEIGAACKDAPLRTGGSGVALGMVEQVARQGENASVNGSTEGIDGPEVILAGSCSGATLKQIQVHRAAHPTVAVDAEAVMAGRVTADRLLDFLLSNTGKAPLIYTSNTPEAVRQAQERYGQERLSTAIEGLLSRVAEAAVDAGIRRLVVAGGETSGAIVNALELKALEIGPEIDPGVPALFSRSDRPLALALKSGNFGAPDFFSKALTLMARPNGARP